MAFGVYVHVPWCASVCGYCDFNTYVPGRAGGAGPATYADTAVAEIALMHEAIGRRRPDTVFLGGGTPTLLEPDDLARVLRALAPAPGAEITIEANPETVDGRRLEALRGAGFTRVSIGMQSAREHVLRTLERVHTPGAATRAARAARAAGFAHVSVDLIYGTPGETDDDWRASLDGALAGEPDHVSAYALTVEPGTRLAAHVRAGRVPAPDEDALARRYEIADATLTGAGLHWYEVSNWARTAAARCHHNLNYWAGGDWWAIGPGAHGHLDGTRFWTHRHPAAHARAVARGELPIAGRETLDAGQRELERLMLSLRTRAGATVAGGATAERLAAEGLLELDGDRAVLTLRGRRLADGVTRALV
jgi:putative oxygen-independent coproporphyrinogen III oxidase